MVDVDGVSSVGGVSTPDKDAVSQTGDADDDATDEDEMADASSCESDEFVSASQIDAQVANSCMPHTLNIPTSSPTQAQSGITAFVSRVLWSEQTCSVRFPPVSAKVSFSEDHFSSSPSLHSLSNVVCAFLLMSYFPVQYPQFAFVVRDT